MSGNENLFWTRARIKIAVGLYLGISIIGAVLNIPGTVMDKELPIPTCLDTDDGGLSCVKTDGAISCFYYTSCESTFARYDFECTDKSDNRYDYSVLSRLNYLYLAIATIGVVFFAVGVYRDSKFFASVGGLTLLAGVWQWWVVMIQLIKVMDGRDGQVDAGCSETIGFGGEYLDILRTTMAASVFSLTAFSPVVFVICITLAVLGLLTVALCVQSACNGDSSAPKPQEMEEVRVKVSGVGGFTYIYFFLFKVRSDDF